MNFALKQLLRAKIQALIAQGNGEADELLPDRADLVRYWVVTGRKRTRKNQYDLTATMRGAMTGHDVMPAFQAVAALGSVAPRHPLPDVAGYAASSMPSPAGAFPITFVRKFNWFFRALSHASVCLGSPEQLAVAKPKAKGKAKAKAANKGPLGLKLEGRSVEDRVASLRAALSM